MNISTSKIYVVSGLLWCITVMVITDCRGQTPRYSIDEHIHAIHTKIAAIAQVCLEIERGKKVSHQDGDTLLKEIRLQYNHLEVLAQQCALQGISLSDAWPIGIHGLNVLDQGAKIVIGSTETKSAETIRNPFWEMILELDTTSAAPTFRKAYATPANRVVASESSNGISNSASEQMNSTNRDEDNSNEETIADQMMNEFIRSKPKVDSEALVRRGASLLKEKRYQEAIDVLNSAIEANPQLSAARKMRTLAIELQKNEP